MFLNNLSKKGYLNMQIIEKYQDLFQEKTNTVIGHCVSLVKY